MKNAKKLLAAMKLRREELKRRENHNAEKHFYGIASQERARGFELGRCIEGLETAIAKDVAEAGFTECLDPNPLRWSPKTGFQHYAGNECCVVNPVEAYGDCNIGWRIEQTRAAYNEKVGAFRFRANAVLLGPTAFKELLDYIETVYGTDRMYKTEVAVKARGEGKPYGLEWRGLKVYRMLTEGIIVRTE